jgi:alpha-tubulin suppressor-like RCC1 family protein
VLVRIVSERPIEGVARRVKLPALVIGLMLSSLALRAPAVRAGTTASTWGDGSLSQLGTGSAAGSTVPVAVSNLGGVVSLAGGYAHGLALKSDGTVWAWGANFDGTLGNGSNAASSIPVQVSGLSGVTAIAAGDYHCLALKSNGTVWAWGDNSSGQLGNGTFNNSNVPVQVGNLSGAIAIAAGEFHSLVVKGDGTVWAWGDNAYGQLGDGTVSLSALPMQVSGLTGIATVAAGGYHSLARSSDGMVWAWGDNGDGEAGNGASGTAGTAAAGSTPLQIAGLSNVAAVAAGWYFSLARKSDNTVWQWGANSNGTLGRGASPTQVNSLSGMTTLAAGAEHALALKNDGTAWAWGFNGYGQLGSGGTSDSSVPVQVSGLTNSTLIGAGWYHSLAAPQTLISGRVTNSSGAGVASVTITCKSSSGATVTTATDSVGNYLFANVPNGSYTLTPTLTGFGFTPASRSVTVNNSTFTNQDFTISAYTISGRVATTSGTPMANVSITLNPKPAGATSPVPTNSAGYYTLSGVPNGSYTVTPSQSGVTFTPASRAVTVNNAAVTGQSFSGATGYRIIGRISNSAGIAMVNVAVTRSGAASPVYTNSAGYFTLSGVPNGSYTITPSLAGYSFSPSSRNVTMNGADVTGQNFIGASGYRIIGRIATSGGMAIANVQVLRNGSTTPVFTNSAGYFTFDGVPNGTYTLTPSLSGRTFTPTTRGVSVNGADVSGANFVGSG